MDKIGMREDFIYFPYIAADAPLQPRLAGVSYCDGAYRIERPPQEIFVFEYIESGAGTLTVTGKTFTPAAGDVYIAPGWHHHVYTSSADRPWIKHWLNVSGPLVEELLRLYGLEGRYFFPAAHEAGKILKQALSALRRAAPDARLPLAASALLAVIMELSKAAAPAAAAAPDPRAEALRNYLCTRIAAPPPPLEELAGVANLSPAQATRIFKRAYMRTPHEFLLEQKIAAASEMLNATNATVREIAEKLGFDDEYYFARLFKKKRGAAPGAYRMNIRKKRTPENPES